MQLPGRLAAAIDVLADIETRHRPVAAALKDWGISHRFAGSSDRAALGNLVYDALRRKLSHAFGMKDDEPRALVLSVAVRDWGEDPVSLAASFAGDKFAPGPISVGELALLTANDPLAGAPEHVQADVPDWLADEFKSAFGDDWVAEGRVLTERPPLDLRTNLLQSDRDAVLKGLRRFDPKPTAISPLGVRLAAGVRGSRTPNVGVDEGYLKGHFEVQDEGSQLVSLLAEAKAGEQVLDYCAGAGGKSLAMAAGMENRGQIFAHDSDRHRLAPIYERLKRNQVRNVQVLAPEPEALEGHSGTMDLVLVDAPCTGTGTWRRRPDAKWRLGPGQLAVRQQEQRAILKDAASFVRPGGRLVYVTCSLLLGENDTTIAGFLAEHPEFSVVPGPLIWERNFPKAVAKVRTTMLDGLMLSPRKTGTDGFYFSCLRRSG